MAHDSSDSSVSSESSDEKLPEYFKRALLKLVLEFYSSNSRKYFNEEYNAKYRADYEKLECIEYSYYYSMREFLRYYTNTENRELISLWLLELCRVFTIFTSQSGRLISSEKSLENMISIGKQIKDDSGFITYFHMLISSIVQLQNAPHIIYYDDDDGAGYTSGEDSDKDQKYYDNVKSIISHFNGEELEIVKQIVIQVENNNGFPPTESIMDDFCDGFD